MASMLIKDVPPRIHSWIKARAQQHRRSMNQEALTILEQALDTPKRTAKLPPAVKPHKPIDHEWLLKATKEGRK